MLDFLLVIPVRNEEKYITDAISRSERILKRVFKNYKIVVVDASSTDQTPAIVRSIAKRDRHVEIIRDRPRGLKGGDIVYSFSKYQAKAYGFIDVDIVKTCIASLPKMARELRSGRDVVIGSRYTTPKDPSRPLLRLFLSKAYNLMLRAAFHDSIRDHQCGFKLFDRRAALLLERELREFGWLWDTEALLICRHGGLSILEQQVPWVEARDMGSMANIDRAAKDIALDIVPVYRMFRRFWMKPPSG